MTRDYTHASFFSGIGAFDLGLELAGFRVVSHAEVKPFSCSVLESRWPGVPNLGDINAICPDGEGDHECELPRADVWTGGFPCSDFSIMGKRKGLLGGNRSSLGLVFLDLVRRHRPPYVILENVPGILSSHEGRDFGLLLGALVDIGYGWSFRLLDARNFGLPQARRRVFVVAALDPRDAGAVLDDATDRRVDAETLGGPRRAVVARGGGRAASRSPLVLGPTYAPRSDTIVRSDGSSFPLLPTNKVYVIEDEPVVAQLATRRGPVNTRADGTAYTIIPDERQWIIGEDDGPGDGPVVIRKDGNLEPHFRRDGSAFTVVPGAHGVGGHGQQYVVEDEPIVIRREGTFAPQVKRDGSTFTVTPTSGRERGNIGEQYVVDGPGRGPGPVVVYPTFSKRDQQRLASRADGASYTILPGATPFVIEDGDGDDGGWDDLWGDAGGLGDDLLDDGRDGGRGGLDPGADLGAIAAAILTGQTRDGNASGRPDTEADADRVRETARLSGRMDDPDGRGVGPMGARHLDSARWHVLGRACPVPIVEWMGQALRTVIDAREGDG